MSTLDTSVRRDEQRTTVWWGISSVNGSDLVMITVDPSTGAMAIEDGSSVMPVMASIPSTMPREGNRIPCLAGVSNANASVLIPVSVNPANGALQVQST